jgi:hypothetical protein
MRTGDCCCCMLLPMVACSRLQGQQRSVAGQPAEFVSMALPVGCVTAHRAGYSLHWQQHPDSSWRSSSRLFLVSLQQPPQQLLLLSAGRCLMLVPA